MTEDREFWIVYDYGMGGVWGVARARSEEEVLRVFPELKVFEEKPEWITPEEEKQIRSESSFAIGDASTYPNWLANR